jgi:phage shock protein E
MIQLIKSILGIGSRVNIAELIANGAIILDVRTRGEYSSGHVKGSRNVPLDQLSDYQKKLKDKEQPIITCCASGMRSATAKSLLKSLGYKNVHNAGSWLTLNKHVK